MTTSTPSLSRTSPAGALPKWILLVVALVACAVYANSLENAFAFDDIGIIATNRHVKDLDWLGIWTSNYWPKTEGVLPDSLYRPLTMWSYLANEAISPGTAWPFHLVNVLLHALVSVLVSVFAWRVLGDRFIALIAGLIFAVHPLHTEAVANTVGRAEILAALWAMLALLIYLPPGVLRDETRPTSRSYWHGILVAICFLVAILCKETPASVMVGIGLIDCWRWARWPREGRPALFKWFGGQALRYYVPLLAVFGLYLIVRIQVCGLMTRVGLIHPIVNPLVQATGGERIVTPFLLLAKYLWLTAWPVHLSADYSAPSLMPTSDVFSPLAALGILTCVLTIVVGIRQWKKSPELILLAGLFVMSYMLVANVIRIGTIFGERLFYWPSVFVIIAASWALVRIAQKARAARVPVAFWTGGALFVVACAAMCRITWVRNTDWASNISLAVATGRDNPASGKACAWAGATLTISGVPAFEKYGVTLIERGLELTPDYVQGWWDLARYSGFHNQLGKSIVCMAEAARAEPGTHSTCIARAAILEQLHTTPAKDYMPAIEAYQRAHPMHEAAYYALALAYHAQKKYDLAEKNIRRALDLGRRPGNDGFNQFHEAGAELAAIKFERGDFPAAVEAMRKYAFFMHNSVDAHCEFASMLMKLDAKKFPDAAKEAVLNAAIANSINPDAPAVREIKGVLSRLHLSLDAKEKTYRFHSIDSQKSSTLALLPVDNRKAR